MSRIALEEALKKPGRVTTWHAGARNRSHRSSAREDYITVLPRELAGMLQSVGSTTTLYEFLEIFVEDLLHEQLEAGEAEAPVLLELRGYFDRWMEFYVREVIPPLPDPGGPGGALAFVAALKRRQPRWLVIANQNAHSEALCYESFDRLLVVAGRVSERYCLKLDLQMARNGFRSMLRRRREADGQLPDWSLLDETL